MSTDAKWLKNTEHTAAEVILRSHPLSSTPTSRTTKSIGRQPNSSHQMHQGRHQNLQARHCSTGHRFLHQWYLATLTTDRRIFYIQSPQPNPDWEISYLYIWFSSVSSSPPTPRIRVTSPTSFSPAHFNALILQHPVFMWSSSSLHVLKQQHLPSSGILLMTIRAYWSKRWVVTSRSFQN